MSRSRRTGGPDGMVTLSTMMLPRLVFVKVQMTVSPGLDGDVGDGAAVVAVPVRSQPVGAVSAAA